METAREGFHLSPQQRRLWSLQRLGSALPAACVVRASGRLDAAALGAALLEVVRRHQILRTTFQRSPGRKFPVQVVHETADARWDEIVDDPASALERALDSLDARTLDDLEKGAPLRARRIDLADGGSLLVLDLPALCADRRSLDHLVAELAAAYAAAAGEESGECDAFQYLQFSEWQNNLAAEGDAESGKAFWRQHLSASAAAQTLPFARQLSREEPFKPRSCKIAIAPEVAGACALLAGATGSTLQLVLLAAWQTLLWRVGGGDDLSLAVLFPCREYEVLERALGLLARYLPVRCRFDQQLDSRQLLRELAAELAEVGGRQDDFALDAALAEALEEEGAFLPFAFEIEERTGPLEAAGVRYSLLEKRCSIDLFQLCLSCVREEDRLSAELWLDPVRFDAADGGRLAGWFAALLAGFARSPGPLAELGLLAAAEREQILALGRGGARRSEESCVHRLFERQAALRPDDLAVVQSDRRSVTYRELEARSRKLAGRLHALGVGPESLVGLCLERSIEMVVGLLGILRAGGAYVPLDPALPGERLGFMLESAAIRTVVTVSEWKGPLQAAPVRTVLVDGDDASPADAGLAPAAGSVVPENLAYVLFTSGSTGSPKGVAIEHRQLASYTAAVSERLGLAEGARFGVVSTFAADLGNTTIYPSLTGGGCLCIASQEEALDPDKFRAFMLRHEVDCLKVAPTHLHALLGSPRHSGALPRRVLVLGGEAADWGLIEDLRALAPDCRIFNHYGPTETTVGVATLAVDQAQPRTGALVPLGRPLAGCELHLLDPRMETLPAGIPGEVNIGGAGLARGYIGRPAETAEKFVPHPFSPTPGDRLYRSGDLARWLPGGDLLFLGRRDHQVKIRGFRVELGEIEAVLRAFPGVADAVAVVCGNTQGEKRLAAYFAAGAGEVDPSALRQFLKERLPEHMVPAALLGLKALPLTANGKVDRQALPSPEEADAARVRAYRAPSTPIEEIVAGIWVEVLKIERVGVDDDFFELGGHSLLAMQIVSRLKETFRTDVPLRTVFQASTVAHLSRALVAGERAPGQMEKIARTIQRVRAMSPEDVQRALAAKKAGAA